MAKSLHNPVTRFAWLAIAAACLTIALKTGAWVMTGSVGLLSDALESVVNLAAAVIALIALTIARKEPDEDHTYGHDKAEYFSSGLEGILIFVAAISIVVSAIPRLLDPRPLEHVWLGLAISLLASLVNLGVARILMQASRAHDSITLEADARHLMTDVITSAGVIAGIVAVTFTDWNRLDPIIALIVAGNIVWTGYNLMRRSAQGLLDMALPEEEIAVIEDVLDRHRQEGVVDMHALRTRRAASRRFASVHIIVPGNWSIEQGHALADRIEMDIRHALPSITVFTHLEPDNDPSTWEDTELDRIRPENHVIAGT
jgi:cation diffusion facilitator family transporter